MRLVGSRFPLAYARETGANFLTKGALDAARARTAVTERHQNFDHQRLWADLLSSEALAFNLFGDLASDLERADRAVRTWWPDARPASCARSASPTRRAGSIPSTSTASAPSTWRSCSTPGDGTHGVVAVDAKYHERSKAEIPRPSNLPRNVEVAERSGAFAPGAVDAVKGRSELAVMWLEHLLLLSMLQHASGSWTWGRYVVVRPAGNTDVADMCGRYRGLQADDSTFSSVTVEELLAAGPSPPALPRPCASGTSPAESYLRA